MCVSLKMSWEIETILKILDLKVLECRVRHVEVVGDPEFLHYYNSVNQIVHFCSFKQLSRSLIALLPVA